MFRGAKGDFEMHGVWAGSGINPIQLKGKPRHPREDWSEMILMRQMGSHKRACLATRDFLGIEMLHSVI